MTSERVRISSVVLPDPGSMSMVVGSLEFRCNHVYKQFYWKFGDILFLCGMLFQMGLHFILVSRQTHQVRILFSVQLCNCPRLIIS